MKTQNLIMVIAFLVAPVAGFSQQIFSGAPIEPAVQGTPNIRDVPDICEKCYYPNAFHGHLLSKTVPKMDPTKRPDSDMSPAVNEE